MDERKRVKDLAALMGKRPPPEIMDPEAVAEYLGIHEETARELMRLGKIPAAKVGRVWRAKKSAIDRMLDTGVVPGPPTVKGGKAPAKKRKR